MLGAPCRSRAAHIVQFRAVGIERLGDELAPEGAEFCEGFFESVAAVRRGVQGCRTDRSHEAGPCFQLRRLAAYTHYSAPENEFSPELLTGSFNCRDLVRHAVIQVC